jgi:hypothetical protein
MSAIHRKLDIVSVRVGGRHHRLVEQQDFHSYVGVKLGVLSRTLNP